MLINLYDIQDTAKEKYQEFNAYEDREDRIVEALQSTLNDMDAVRILEIVVESGLYREETDKSFNSLTEMSVEIMYNHLKEVIKEAFPVLELRDTVELVKTACEENNHNIESEMEKVIQATIDVLDGEYREDINCFIQDLFYEIDDVEEIENRLPDFDFKDEDERMHLVLDSYLREEVLTDYGLI